jgi:hypothetical protein
MQRLLPGLCRAEYLAHRSDLALRRSVLSPQRPLARLEYRLYTLFAE